MYGVRINFNDNKPDPIQYLNYDEGVQGDGGYYIDTHTLELAAITTPEPVAFMAKVLITFLLENGILEIEDPDTHAIYRRDVWLNILIDIEHRCSTEEINPGMYRSRKDRLPYYKHIVIEVVKFTPEVHSAIEIK